MPPPDSDLAQQALKDPYIFDFLTLKSNFHERELEAGLIVHLDKFLLELGQDFAFVRRQYQLDIKRGDFKYKRPQSALYYEQVLIEFYRSRYDFDMVIVTTSIDILLD